MVSFLAGATGTRVRRFNNGRGVDERQRRQGDAPELAVSRQL